MNKLLMALLAVTFSASAFAGVDIEVKLLKEKADLCIKSNFPTSKYCQDFDSFSDYVFKGNSSTWINYHLEVGDINDNNMHEVFLMLESVDKATKLTAQR
jgi:hypothetical protein